MSTPISGAAEAARETSRTTDGKFGQQLRDEAPAPDLPVLGGVEYDLSVRRAEAMSSNHPDAYAEAAMLTLAAAAARIRRDHPDARTMHIVNYQGADSVHMVVLNSDGFPVAATSSDADVDLHIDLQDLGNTLPMDDPRLMRKFTSNTVGFKTSDPDDTDAGEVTGMYVNLDDILDNANSDEPPTVGHLKDMIGARSKASYDALNNAIQAVNENALAGAALTIREEHPEAVTMTLANDDEGGVNFEAEDADGNSIDLSGDEMTDDLWQHGGEITLDRPSLLQCFAQGHVEGDPESGAFSINDDHHGYSMKCMTVDIDDMIGRITKPRFASNNF